MSLDSYDFGCQFKYNDLYLLSVYWISRFRFLYPYNYGRKEEASVFWDLKIILQYLHRWEKRIIEKKHLFLKFNPTVPSKPAERFVSLFLIKIDIER